MSDSNDVAKYTINGNEFTQTYLTIGQTIGVTEIFQSINFEKDLNVANVLKYLYDTGKLESFFNIVLDGSRDVKVDEIKPVLAVEIVSDFLSFNEISKIFIAIVSVMTQLNRDQNLKTFLAQKKPNSRA